jgi:predicted 3-demethylubiquinone-9 3-methyltransferase (glyoxalase superfamily)
MSFYVSLFPGSEVTELVRYRAGQPGAEGTLLKGAFTLGGASVLCTHSAVRHEFGFTPAISLFANCESEDEIARLAGPLSEGGTTFMPLGNYGFSRKFARVSDRFGVPWQLSLA